MPMIYTIAELTIPYVAARCAERTLQRHLWKIYILTLILKTYALVPSSDHL
jgi:hypothetical protein